MSESDVYRRQILTSKVDPIAVRVKILKKKKGVFYQFIHWPDAVIGNVRVETMVTFWACHVRAWVYTAYTERAYTEKVV